jgi:ribosomal protein L33
MSPGARMECTESTYLRYKRASRKEKTLILDEFCAACGYHRKHAIRLLKNFKRFTKPRHKKRGAPSVYNKPPITEPLKRIWLAV